VIVAVTLLVTAVVFTVNEPVVDPAGIVTLVGLSVAEPLLLDRLTVVLEPAGPPSVTVPEEARPPTTVVGLRDTETESGLTVSVSVLFAPA